MSVDSYDLYLHLETMDFSQVFQRLKIRTHLIVISEGKMCSPISKGFVRYGGYICIIKLTHINEVGIAPA
jgi:hypothetical protein